ncbi:hypothetical protein BDV38DRAFT_249077 [Aspergillus pseudotamarii]|uniref:SPIN90/Ldb17 leucine-rich domain-containing protein n=1 Tax=Aspergillus pseudotamarii TaxID=132259 RepID=A0A5N6SSI3_ASPPS|nr:uncharacterized protein BDV38DRAFT_249077 [Aspergillus pseudotamarii]KAE8136751.1 hypothetical protein BDV38DRAFT_249077 [Aspergillus pseudotamarii]
MEFEVSLENEQQFWDEIQEIVSALCSSEDLIDNALRSYLNLATKYKDEYLQTELEVTRCSYKLLSSKIFASHADYVRRQMIYGLLQDDDSDTLCLISSFLLFDGRQNEVALHMMNEEGAFPRLLELLQAQNRKKDVEGDGTGLHRLFMDLIYEMSRIQRIKIEDLVLVDDEFVKSLFDIIEELSYDSSDPYHYTVIRVLLVLNEQFMISAHDPVDEKSSTPLTNKVIKILSMHGNLYKTFGENIILLINREAETSLQLLTLKLLYLIFTTPTTFEYFYTNDLHVLVDILIRNLLDLPEEASALRHTYLRVLYPLLAHTQLKTPPHYKQEELRRMLSILVRGQLSSNEIDQEKIMHFDEVDETTRRLVVRCATVDWLRDEEPDAQVPKNPEETITSCPTIPDGSHSEAGIGTPLEPTISQPISPTSTVESSPVSLSPTYLDESPKTEVLNQAQRLGMHLEPASSSSLSVQEVAAQHEKPGVLTPSRNKTQTATTDRPSSPNKPKVKPLPPKSRRWRGRRTTGDENDKIPEEPGIGTGASPSPSPVTPSTPSIPQGPSDRRNSTSTSGLVPPIPAHSRRSASNPPPAVPPPRRSTLPVVHPHHVSSHCTPVTSPSRLQIQQSSSSAQKHGQKPEPPKTRRSGRRRPSQTDSPTLSQDGHDGHAALPEVPSEKRHDNMTVSVEEAVQNVSLS